MIYTVKLNGREYYMGGNKEGTQALLIRGIISAVLFDYKLSGVITIERSEKGVVEWSEREVWTDGVKQELHNEITN